MGEEEEEEEAEEEGGEGVRIWTVASCESDGAGMVELPRPARGFSNATEVSWVVEEEDAS